VVSQLQPRTALEVSEALIDYFVGATPKVTDLTEGSVLRTILESAGREIARLEIGVMLATQNAILQSTYTTFGFPLLGPLAATGQALFILDQAVIGTVTIPRGTIVRVPGVPAKTYQTTVDTTVVRTGDPSDPITVPVTIVALQPGSIGNTPAGTITEIVGGIAGVTGVDNSRTLFNGTDAETDAERELRFDQFILSIQRSTRDAILAGAKSTRILDDFGYVVDQVRKASTVENNPDLPNEASGINDCNPGVPNPDNPRPGTIWVFVHNGVSTPTLELVEAAAQVLEGYEDTNTSPSTITPGFRPSAIECKVFPAEEQVVPVSLAYGIAPGYVPEQIEPEVNRAITTYFQTLDVGQTFIVEQLKRQIASTAGILDFSLSAPTTNVACSYKQLAVVGPVVITLVEDLG
jgi:hypothetical protein